MKRINVSQAVEDLKVCRQIDRFLVDILKGILLARLGSRAPATCKPQGNQQFRIVKICWKSKSDPNTAIPHLKNRFKYDSNIDFQI